MKLPKFSTIKLSIIYSKFCFFENAMENSRFRFRKKNRNPDPDPKKVIRLTECPGGCEQSSTRFCAASVEVKIQSLFGRNESGEHDIEGPVFFYFLV